MATVHPCRKDRHNYQEIAGAIAGLSRRSCVTCGSVQIDVRTHTDEVNKGMSVFSARRPTLFTLRSETVPEKADAVSAGFGMRRRRRRG
jgi:hypothetical protein